MTLEEQTIREIKQLPPQHLSQAYNYILYLKGGKAISGKKRKSAPYLKARKVLSKCGISLSEDIITHREDRI